MCSVGFSCEVLVEVLKVWFSVCEVKVEWKVLVLVMLSVMNGLIVV